MLRHKYCLSVASVVWVVFVPTSLAADLETGFNGGALV